MRVKERIFSSYARCQIRVPPGKRKAASEFFIHANHGLTLGNFEMDWNDGEVGFKTSVVYKSSELSSEMVEHMVGAGFSTLARYIPGLMAVCHANKDPKIASDDCESTD